MLQTVARPELDDAVSEGLERTPVVVVSAPAGFGKTVAAAGWARSRASGAGPIGPETETVDDAHRLSATRLDALVAEAHAGGTRVVLLGRPGISQVFDAVADHPRTSVVGPRRLALSRRALIDRFGRDGARIHACTAGWPIAVWAATGGSAGATGWPTVFARYLDDHVLVDLTPARRRIVFDTVGLRAFRAQTVGAVLGAEADAHLGDLAARHGLLVAERDGEDTVYRWPETIAAGLGVLATAEDPQRRRQIARAAADHVRGHDPVRAATYAREAGAFDLAIEIVYDQWPRLVSSAAAGPVEALLAGLPAPWCARAEVLRMRACCLRTLGREELIPALLARARARERTGADVVGWVAAVSDVFLLDDPASVRDAIAHAEAEAAAWCPPALMLQVRVLLGAVRVRSRIDDDGGVAMATELLQQAVAGGDAAAVSRARGIAMWALLYAGRFHDLAAVIADDHIAEPAEVSVTPRFDTGIGWFARGYLAYWRGDLDEALHLFESLDAAPITAEWRWFGAVYYAGIVAESGRADLVTSAVARLTELPDGPKFGFDWPGVKRSLLIRMQSHRQQLGGPIDTGSLGDEVTVAMLAAALAADGDLTRAAALIDGYRDRWQPLHARLCAVLVEALIARHTGDHHAVRRHMDAAFALSAESGAVQPLLRPDPAIGVLLAEYVRDGGPHRSRAEAVLARRATHRPADPLGALTDREENVLGLIAEDLTLQEIAVELAVSINTVKTHLRSVYRKLGVSNRRAAAAVWAGGINR